MSPNIAISDEILSLKEEKDVVILSHNYQIPEVQDISDFVGDSLGLSRKASTVTESTILFCGVYFMAETASIINPNKTVLIPDTGAGCSLVDSSPSIDWVEKWNLTHPGGIVVSYVNTSAVIKAASDYCCTSSNAVKIVESIPSEKEILFLPDMFLGAYVQEKTGRTIDIWPGECHVHAGITSSDLDSSLAQHSDHEFLIHPECGCGSNLLYSSHKDNISHPEFLSTEGMVDHVKNSSNDKFIIATETGILHRLKKEAPDKTCLPLKNDAICKYMKMINLEKVRFSLLNMVHEVKVDEYIASKSRSAIQKMLDIS